MLKLILDDIEVKIKNDENYGIKCLHDRITIYNSVISVTLSKLEPLTSEHIRDICGYSDMYTDKTINIREIEMEIRNSILGIMRKYKVQKEGEQNGHNI
uniref:Uncharacterized protein n=1 Tax=viral metagenome TaxID=1070528 RepID=A0A6M3LIF7_9ZZZZ